jgi:hypothetical protein
MWEVLPTPWPPPLSAAWEDRWLVLQVPRPRSQSVFLLCLLCFSGLSP